MCRVDQLGTMEQVQTFLRPSKLPFTGAFVLTCFTTIFTACMLGTHFVGEPINKDVFSWNPEEQIGGDLSTVTRNIGACEFFGVTAFMAAVGANCAALGHEFAKSMPAMKYVCAGLHGALFFSCLIYMSCAYSAFSALDALLPGTYVESIGDAPKIAVVAFLTSGASMGLMTYFVVREYLSPSPESEGFTPAPADIDSNAAGVPNYDAI